MRTLWRYSMRAVIKAVIRTILLLGFVAVLVCINILVKQGGL